MAVYDEVKGAQSNTKDAANPSRFSLAPACLPPLLQVRLVGLESTALQKRLARAADYWVVGRKRFFIFLRTQKQTTNQTREQDKTRRTDKPEHASVSERRITW
jgi:hypothetical protein